MKLTNGNQQVWGIHNQQTNIGTSYQPKNFAGRGRQHIPQTSFALPILKSLHGPAESGLTNKKSHRQAGISPQTISVAFYELTRRPQFFTVNAV